MQANSCQLPSHAVTRKRIPPIRLVIRNTLPRLHVATMVRADANRRPVNVRENANAATTIPAHPPHLRIHRSQNRGPSISAFTVCNWQSTRRSSRPSEMRSEFHREIMALRNRCRPFFVSGGFDSCRAVARSGDCAAILTSFMVADECSLASRRGN